MHTVEANQMEGKLAVKKCKIEIRRKPLFSYFSPRRCQGIILSYLLHA